MSENHTTSPATAQAVFGAGCFWGVEARFLEIEGVLDAESGYCGGSVKNPTYEQVCRDNTGHAEVVRVTFDPARVGFEALARAFFAMHNPTELNRQGPDKGTQYRSVVFAQDEAQAQTTRKVIDELSASGDYRGAPSPIVTKIEPPAPFYRAEEYHQRYLAKHGRSACSL